MSLCELGWVCVFQCQPCTPSLPCADNSMFCNTDTNTCICKRGLRLDSSGTKCVITDQTSTSLDCLSNTDCSIYPNSYCDLPSGEQQTKWRIFSMLSLSIDLNQHYFATRRDCKKYIQQAIIDTCGRVSDWYSANIMAGLQRLLSIIMLKDHW